MHNRIKIFSLVLCSTVSLLASESKEANPRMPAFVVRATANTQNEQTFSPQGNARFYNHHQNPKPKKKSKRVLQREHEEWVHEQLQQCNPYEDPHFVAAHKLDHLAFIGCSAAEFNVHQMPARKLVEFRLASEQNRQ